LIDNWSDLEYWKSKDWATAKEKLNVEEASIGYNPHRSKLFAALGAVHPVTCRVAIVGQDPYPRREHCTGIAFAVPRSIPANQHPPTLINIFKEYEQDLGLPRPMHGDLSKWCEQGILLWNAYPSCATGKPGSHHWTEWESLTREIMGALDAHPMVFAFLGKVASSFSVYVFNNPVITVSHPSPLGVRRGFAGSKLFSNINSELANLGQPPIDWRLT
jgi:uracil-DNA glycosylase